VNAGGANAPLAGLRVLEFGHIAAAPFCGMLLADLGADVVKVESPEGDGLRAWPPIVTNAAGETFSLNFASLNRGKRSIVANLKDPLHLARILALCARVDVIIENYRPGALDRLGVGFEDVAKRNASIVYCSISGYGQQGERARKGAFDVVVQGGSGLMSVTGEPDRPPVKCGVPVADFTAGLYAAYTILAARASQVREPRAVHLDCAMLDCLLGISALQTSEYWGTGIAPKRLGSAHPRNAPYQAFDASDAQFIIAAGNDTLWREVCEATGQVELLDDPRFASIALRAKNQAALAAILQQVFGTRTVREWLDEFERRGVPSGPMNTFADILADPALAASALIQTMAVPVAGRTKTVAYPVQIDGRRVRASRPPPRLGEHSDEVFAEWTGETPKLATAQND
jgi:crotonobetainyl-CoA:carnitine CoA-transferase CaiB-like acyl-CoA transferase